jgi:hypothetical protein
LGRFAQPDTVLPEPGDPQQLNRFAYARNNPLRYTDQTGHYIEEWTGPTVDEAHEGNPSPVFFDPALAERAWGVREAMRVSREVDTAENVGYPGDWEIVAAATSPLWAPAGALAVGSLVEGGGPLVVEGAKAAWPVVAPILAKAAPGAGASAAGDFVGQIVTTGTWKPEKTLVAGLVGGVSSFIPGGEGLLPQIGRGIGVAETQLALTNLAAGEGPPSWESIAGAGIAGGLFSPLSEKAEKFWTAASVEAASNIGQGLVEWGLRKIDEFIR